MSTYFTVNAQVAGRLKDVMKVHRLILRAEFDYPAEDFNCRLTNTWPGDYLLIEIQSAEATRRLLAQSEDYILLSYQSGKSSYRPQVAEVLRHDIDIEALDVCMLVMVEAECYLAESFCWFQGFNNKKVTKKGLEKQCYRDMGLFVGWCRERGLPPSRSRQHL